jgi:hypothetical protein
MVKKSSSTAAILGNSKKSASKTHCIVCLKPIPAERIEALKLLGVPISNWTHVACCTTTKVKGLYMGEVGTSELKLCDKVYNDSVRSVFRRAEVSENESDEPEDAELDKD